MYKLLFEKLIDSSLYGWQSALIYQAHDYGHPSFRGCVKSYLKYRLTNNHNKAMHKMVQDEDLVDRFNPHQFI